jgi:hypothetical protein
MATATADTFVPNLPDATAKVRDVFGIDSDLEVPAYSTPPIASTARPRSRSSPGSPTTAAS